MISSKVDIRIQCHSVKPDKLTLLTCLQKSQRHLLGNDQLVTKPTRNQEYYKAAVIRNCHRGQTHLWSKTETPGRRRHSRENTVHNTNGSEARRERGCSVDELGPPFIHTESKEMRTFLCLGPDD